MFTCSCWSRHLLEGTDWSGKSQFSDTTMSTDSVILLSLLSLKDEQTDGQKDEQMDRRTNRQMDGKINRRTEG